MNLHHVTMHHDVYIYHPSSLYTLLFLGARQATSDSNPLPVISALMIIAGLFRVFYSLYRFVTLLSGKVLESAESMILESLHGKRGGWDERWLTCIFPFLIMFFFQILFVEAELTLCEFFFSVPNCAYPKTTHFLPENHVPRTFVLSPQCFQNPKTATRHHRLFCNRHFFNQGNSWAGGGGTRFPTEFNSRLGSLRWGMDAHGCLLDAYLPCFVSTNPVLEFV